MSQLVFTTAVLLAAVSSCLGLNKLQLLYGWQTVDFKFPSRAARDSMIRTGAYIPGNSVPLDVDAWQTGNNNRVFVTLPQLRPGTPATLATVSTDGSENPSAPRLVPYPDWSWHRPNECDGLTSVFRIRVDSCDRLWVLDTGYVDVLSSFKKVCPAQLVIFDLNTDKMVRRHRFADNVMVIGSLPVTVAVDIRNNNPSGCNEAFAYIADVTEFALAVYDFRNDRSWRVTSNLFYPYPTAGFFDIAGDQFDLMDGVIGLALSPVRAWDGGERYLYFHSLASIRESWVSTSILRNASLFEGGVNRAARMFHVLDNNRPSQTAAEDMDRNGVMFFGLLSQNSLNCWNAARPYGGNNIIELERDDVALQFASGLKVVTAREQQEVWMLTSRFQKLMTGDVNRNEVNFRVLRAPVSTLVKQTPCDTTSQQFQKPSTIQKPAFFQ